jgi:hypothetical protein
MSVFRTVTSKKMYSGGRINIVKTDLKAPKSYITELNMTG